MKRMVKKWTTVLLAAVLAVAFMPAGFGVLGGDAPGSGPGVEKAYAGGDGLGDIVRGSIYYGGKKVCYSGDRLYVPMSDLDAKFGGEFSTMYENKKIECYFDSRDPGSSDCEKELAAFYDKDVKQFYYNVHPGQYGKQLTFYTRTLEGDTSNNRNSESIIVSTAIDFTVSKGGVVTVTGKSMDHTFSNVKVDGGYSVLPSSQEGKSNVSFTFSVTNRKNFSTGRHSLTGYLNDGTTCSPLAGIPVSIYAKPALKAKMFNTNKNSFTLKPGAFDSAAYGDIYIDYKKGANGKWNTQWGPFGAGSSGKVSKLSAGSVYYVRAYYVKKIGNEYFIGPVSSAVKIKTGPKKKPAVKSVKITKAKVKKVKVKSKYYWDNGTLKYLKGYTTYETTYKVTVKFKKKQKIAGIQIYAGGVTLPKFIKGSKKSYTAKFTVGGKRKGKKTSFKIRTKGNASYGAWSPTYKSKKVRIR